MGKGASGALVAGVSNLAIIATVMATPVSARVAEQAAGSELTPAAQQPARSVTMAVPLVWSGQVLGDVVVQVEPDGAIAIETQSLRNELGRLLNEAGLERLDESIAGDPFVTPAELSTAGFDIGFDMARLELTVNSIDPALRPVEPLRGRSESTEVLLPSMEAARFSAYLNTSVNLIYRDRDGIVPPDVFLFGAARYRDIVVEFDGGLTEDVDDNYRFYRRAVRAVYDEPEKFRRWSAGDLQLDNTGMLRTPFIGGVALEKSRRTFDPVE